MVVMSFKPFEIQSPHLFKEDVISLENNLKRLKKINMKATREHAIIRFTLYLSFQECWSSEHCSPSDTTPQEHTTVTKTDPTDAASLVSIPAPVSIPNQQPGQLPTGQGRRPPWPSSVCIPSPTPCSSPFTGDRTDYNTSREPL